MNGVLVIDKPPGPTSHDVVLAIRRATGVQKVGHTGTLDHPASGVLPLVLGCATRLARFLTAAEKEYEADIRLGVVTDTYDATGTVVQRAETPPTVDGRQLDEALTLLCGTYDQAPPPFSAKKIAGVRAYERARRQEPVAPAPARVTVGRIDVLDAAGDLIRLHIVCSSGFYVRSLAHDLGARLGTGGHLERLTRVRSGDFVLAGAIPLRTAIEEGPAALARLVPLDRLLSAFPMFVLTDEGVRRASHGNDVGPRHLLRPPAAPAAGLVRLLDRRGVLVALAETAGPSGALHPTIVLV